MTIIILYIKKKKKTAQKNLSKSERPTLSSPVNIIFGCNLYFVKLEDYLQ